MLLHPGPASSIHTVIPAYSGRNLFILEGEKSFSVVLKAPKRNSPADPSPTWYAAAPSAPHVRQKNTGRTDTERDTARLFSSQKGVTLRIKKD